MAASIHSVVTASSPRLRNLRMPRCSFRMPNTGSTTACRLRYQARPATLRNFSRMRRCSGSRMRHAPMPSARSPVLISWRRLLSGTYRSIPRCFIWCKACPLKNPESPVTFSGRTLSEFLRRHRRAINNVFTQVVQMARRAGLGKLGHVAIDSTRVRANASRRKVMDWEQARQQWARDRRLVRRFQQKASQQDPEEDGGVRLSAEQQQALAQQGVPALPKKGRQQVSRTDPESRFLRTARGWELGYTADLAVSDDHVIVATRVTQNATDDGSLLAMVEEVERQCRARPEKVTGDSGFFSGQAVREMKQRGIDLYLPDNNLRHEMRTGERAEGIGRRRIRDPEHQRMREKLRTTAGRAQYRRRQAVVEPVFGILKEQRGMRRFRRRGLAAVSTEWMMAAIAYNLTRIARG